MAVTFSEGSTVTFPQPSAGGRMVFIDADSDGDMDILYQIDVNGSAFQYARSNGDGTYTILALADSPFAGLAIPDFNGANFHVGDIDGDGDFDLWAGQTTGSGTGSFFRNDSGTFTEQDAGSFPQPLASSRVLMADFDGDGDADMLYQSGGNGTGFFYAEANGDGTYSISGQASSPFADVTLADNVNGTYYAGDFDGDGDVDVWAAANSATGSFYSNDGDGTFSSLSTASFPAPQAATRAVVGDFDSDGDDDILYQTGADGSAWQYARSNGNGTFTILSQASSPFAGVTLVNHNGSNALAGDVDGDGDDDLIITPNGTTGEVYYASGKPPAIAGSTPADGATGVATNANIVLTYDESVTKGSGNIYLYRGDGILIETISVNSAQVTGSGTTWTIDPSGTLLNGFEYYVLTDAGVFRDADGSESVAITDPTALNFTTVAAPTFTNLLGDVATFVEGSGPVRLDVGGNATVTDIDSADFDGGVMTVYITTNANPAQDVLSIADIGTGAGMIGVSGSAISYGGVQFATFTGGTGGTNLVITFDADADAAAVQALVRALQYDNTSGSPTSGRRNISISMTDGDGQTSITQNSGVAFSLTGVANSVMISEVKVGPSTDEFIELHNTTGSAVDISGWTVNYRSALGSTDQLLVTFPAGTILPAGGFLLLGGPGYAGAVPADFSYSAGSLNSAGGGVGLRAGTTGTAPIIDSMVYGSAQTGHVFREGAGAIPASPPDGQSLVRTAYTNDTGADWTLDATPGAQNAASPAEIVGGGTTGADYLLATTGDDTIDGLAGNDIIKGGAGNDTLSGGADSDDLRGEDDNDYLDGGDGDDLLAGGSGDDELHGGAGNDVLKGLAGADAMYGGDGDDSYYVSEAGDTVFENANEGVDTIFMSLSTGYTLLANFENITYAGATTGDFTVTGNAADNVIIVELGNQTVYGLAGDDTLWGGNGDDTMYGGDDDDTLFGELHNDTLYGGDGADILDGGAGNDILDGGLGADSLFGGAGNDTYYLDDPDDTLFETPGAGTDTVYTGMDHILGANFENLVLTGVFDLWGTGNALANVITGNSGSNVLRGFAGNDVLSGMDGGDFILGGDGADTLDGGNGEDMLSGEAGTDVLNGGADNDELLGGGGVDSLNGGDGDDSLTGGAGGDFLTGGLGADTFIMDTATLRLSGQALAVERDYVTDFSLAQGDRIDLSGIDAIAGGSDDAFTFVAKFTGQAGQAVLALSGANTILRLDVDGDGKTDHEVVIQGVTLTITDDAWIL